MIDFSDRADLRLLRTLMERADLVIEASRPRVMEQLGIRPAALAVNAATSWISITGHGRTDDPTRIGFGDDAAVAGGLWVDEAAGPAFVADAVADPLTGMVAGALGAELLAGDRATVVDVPLARVAARAASSLTGYRCQSSRRVSMAAWTSPLRSWEAATASSNDARRSASRVE